LTKHLQNYRQWPQTSVCVHGEFQSCNKNKFTINVHVNRLQRVKIIDAVYLGVNSNWQV